MTQVLTIASLKGGTGKTTSAILLATALVRRGHTVTVIDTDPQGSATEWAQRASDDGNELEFQVTVGNARTIARSMPTTDVVIIDCPPGNPQIIDAAIDAADHVIIPVRPSAIEVDRMWETLDLADGANATVLLTSVILSAKATEDLRALLNEEHVGVFPGNIPQREAIKNYFGVRPKQDLFGYDAVAAALMNGQED